MRQKLLIVYFIFVHLTTVSTVDIDVSINVYLSLIVYLGKKFDKSELQAWPEQKQITCGKFDPLSFVFQFGIQNHKN